MSKTTLSRATLYRAAALLAMSAASTVLGAERTVWQIGKPDHDYSEFAFAGDYPAYAAKFGDKPVVFEVGRSDPARDWPFIQPGPLDVGRPARGKPWTIRFTLPESRRGSVTAARSSSPTCSGSCRRGIVVAIGDRSGAFQLAAGGGDASLTNPRAGKPQKIDIDPAGRFLPPGGERDPPDLRRGLLGPVRRDHA